MGDSRRRRPSPDLCPTPFKVILGLFCPVLGLFWPIFDCFWGFRGPGSLGPWEDCLIVFLARGP